MKKIISLLLFLSLFLTPTLITAMTLPAIAESSESSVIEIYNVGDNKTTLVSLLGTTLAENTTYKLMEDIDLGGIELSSASITLANGAVIDGQGHTVTGFKLVGGNGVGLFNGSIGKGTVNIRNIKFGSKAQPIVFDHDGGNYGAAGMGLIKSTDSGVTINLNSVNMFLDANVKGSSWQNHGGLVARNWGTLNIEGCTVNGKISGHGQIGGFVGDNLGGKITIKNSTNNANITADGGGFYGGFIGYVESTGKTVSIIGCTNNGTVDGERSVGGFVGEIAKNEHLIITDSVNNGRIVGKKSTGGIVGLVTLGRITAKRFTNNAAVEAINNEGDAGAIIGKIAAAEANITVTECVNYGAVKASSGMAGGIVGKVLSSSGSIEITDFLNTGKLNSSSAAAAGVGIAENYVDGAKEDNSSLTISAIRLVNLGDIYAKWNTGAIVGHSNIATLIIKNCVSCSSLTTSDKKADVFAKFTAKSEDESVPYASVTAEGNVFVLNADLNSTEAEQKTAAEALDILNDPEKGYKVGKYALNASKNRIVALIPPTVEGTQIRTNSDGTLSIRFVGTIHSLDYKEVGFKITLDGEEKEALRRSTVFSSLVGKNGDGTVQELTAMEIGGAYIYAITLEDVSADGSHVIRVVPYSVRGDGSLSDGIGYTLTVTDGILVSAISDEIEIEEEPEPNDPNESETGGGTTEPENPDDGGTGSGTTGSELDIPIVDDEEGATLGPIISPLRR